MKKVLIASVAALTLSVAAFASPEIVARLNAEIAKQMQPYNNNNTQAKMEFKGVEENDTSVLAAELSGFFQKVGPSDTATMVVDSIRYNAAPGNNAAPVTTARASVNLNFIKLIGQDTINDIVPDLADMIANIIANQAGKYKDAIVVNAKVTETKKDAAGNYTEAKGTVNLTVDFSKLPKDTTKADVPVTGAQLTFDFVAAKSVSLEFAAQSNLDYKGFRADQQGLKEYLDLLLTRDSKTLQTVDDMLKKLDGYANRITGNE